MATTTNYGWDTPDDTDLVKDGAAAIRTLGSSIDTTVFANASAGIAKTIVDDKGDIIAATANDTVDRLAVGANDTVLTADSTTATGLKWAAPSAGSYTLLASGSLSGTSLTLSSISQAYENLVFIYKDVHLSAGTSTKLRWNGQTGANYQGSLQTTDSTTISRDNNATGVLLIAGGGEYTSSASKGQTVITIQNYATANGALVSFYTKQQGNSGMTYGYATNDSLATPAAITSLTLLTTNGTATFSAGTYELFGVK
jgi:hypothetical protein